VRIDNKRRELHGLSRSGDSAAERGSVPPMDGASALPRDLSAQPREIRPNESLRDFQNRYVTVVKELQQKYPWVREGASSILDPHMLNTRMLEREPVVRSLQQDFSNWLRSTSFSDLVSARETIGNWMEDAYCHPEEQGAQAWISSRLEAELFRRGPFPNLRRERPQVYEQAVKAAADYDRMRDFEPYHRAIQSFADSITFGLDKRGNLEITFSKDSFLKHATDTAAKIVFDHVQGETISFIFGASGPSAASEAMARRLAVAGLVFDLHDVYNKIRAEKIANYGDDSMGPVRARLAVDLSCGVFARTRGQAKELKDRFYEFETRREKYHHFQLQDEALDPRRRPQAPASFRRPR
jgi:hypothetical protein